MRAGGVWQALCGLSQAILAQAWRLMLVCSPPAFRAAFEICSEVWFMSCSSFCIQEKRRVLVLAVFIVERRRCGFSTCCSPLGLALTCLYIEGVADILLFKTLRFSSLPFTGM